MYNIMHSIERHGSEKFIEEWGNLLVYFSKQKINIFALDKYTDEENKLWGIRIGLRFNKHVTLESSPRNFQENLNPSNIEGFDERIVKTPLLQVYNQRDIVNIALTQLKPDEVYYTSIKGIKMSEDSENMMIYYNDAIRSTEIGYYNDGSFLFFNISLEDKEKLNEIEIPDSTIYSFLKIYILTWFMSQRGIN